MFSFLPKDIFESEVSVKHLNERFATPQEMRNTQSLILHGIYIGFYGLFKYLHLPFANHIRYCVLRLFSKNIESKSIADGVMIWFPWNVKIGKESTVNQGVIIDGFGGVDIGRGVRIAAYCCFNTADHNFENPNKFIKDQGYVVAGIRVEDDVWLGSAVKVNKGITIGKGSIIGAGSVVTKNIPPYSIAVGVPCKVVASRNA